MVRRASLAAAPLLPAIINIVLLDAASASRRGEAQRTGLRGYANAQAPTSRRAREDTDASKDREVRPNCAQYACPDSYTPIDDAGGVECSDGKCTTEQCCAAYCSYYWCPDGYTQVADADKKRCGGVCNERSCCEKVKHESKIGSCSSYKCPRGRELIDGADREKCMIRHSYGTSSSGTSRSSWDDERRGDRDERDLSYSYEYQGDFGDDDSLPSWASDLFDAVGQDPDSMWASGDIDDRRRLSSAGSSSSDRTGGRSSSTSSSDHSNDRASSSSSRAGSGHQLCDDSVCCH